MQEFKPETAETLRDMIEDFNEMDNLIQHKFLFPEEKRR